ncbi:MAG: hypothetical protein IKB70_02655 [Bacilli bacterium]|nr:hypothetical protein [Bacilli bacterium]
MKKTIKFKDKQQKKDMEHLRKALKKLEKVKDVEVDEENYVATLYLFEDISDPVLERIFEEEEYEIVNLD